MNVIPKNLLHLIDLFSDLDVEETSRIGETCDWQRYSKSREIVGQHAPSSDVFFVAEGRVGAKSYSTEGKEVTYTEISKGEIFGEFSAIDGQPRSAAIRTLEESYIASMSSARFRALIAEHPALGLKLAEHLVRKNRYLSERIYEFSTMTVRHRICAELLRMIEAGAEAGNDGPVTIDKAPSHYEFATRLSTHREAVSREFSSLASKGIIKAGRKKLTVLDVPGLRRMMEVEMP